MSIDQLENKGFSLAELKEAGIDKRVLRFNHYRVDDSRKTCKSANVDLLKKLELKPIPKKEKAPRKEKKPKEKKVEKPKKEEKAAVAAGDLKVKALDQLEGMTPTILQKLKDLGIETPEKFIGEDVKELAGLTKLTQKQLKAWIAQIKGE
jgi:predicted flap endonuclease-1-like 5' DNA nuclease